MNEKEHILIVDDEEGARRTLALTLERVGYEVETAETGEEALAKDKDKEISFNLALLDIKLPDMAGTDLIKPLKESNPELVVMMITGYAALETAVQALNEGASAYITKPLDMDEVLASIDEALDKQRLIRDKHQAEWALRESEERYRTIFNTMPVSIWEEDFSKIHTALKDLESHGVTDLRAYLEEHPKFIDQVMERIEVKDVNAQTLKMFGAESKEELLSSYKEVLTPETREILREEILAIHEGKTFFEGETVNRTLQGEKLNVLFTMTIPSEEENLNSVLVSMMDITERKRAEESLAEQEEKFRAIFNNANDALYVHKLTEEGMPGRIIEVNDTACEMLGYTKEEFRTLSPQDIDDPDAAAKVPDILQGLFKEGDATFEIRHVTKEGSNVPVEISSHLFTLAGERLVLSVARDITERKEAERALKQSEEKYRRFFQTVQDCVFITSQEGQWLEMNQAAVDMFGYDSKEELEKVNVANLYADPQKREKHLSEIDNKGFTKDYPVKLRKKRRCGDAHADLLHTV